MRRECVDSPFALLPHIQQLALYHTAGGGRSPLGGVGSGDATYYGSGWSLLRWAIDHSGVSEELFLRALVGEGTLRGAANLEARTGMPWVQIVIEWGLASALDGLPGARHSHPSWDIPGLLNGIAGVDVPVAPLPVASFRHDGVAVRGGSSVFFEAEGGSNRTISLERRKSDEPVVFTVVRLE